MDEEKRPLTEEEAIAFAGVTESTLHRYISAGFINPVVDGEQRFFDEDELIQVFELSPKKAAASRKALKKKALSPAEKLISEKDRLVADKDIQIRDLKDQRSWLQSRVERLEAELAALKSQANTHRPETAPETIAFIHETRSQGAPAISEVSTQDEKLEVPPAEQIQAEELIPGSESEQESGRLSASETKSLAITDSTTAHPSESSLKKVLRYLGFIKPELSAPLQPAITSRTSEIIALDRTGDRVATVPPSDESASGNTVEVSDSGKSIDADLSTSNNVIEVKFPVSTPSPDLNNPAQTTVNRQPGAPTSPVQPIRGNRPFRESKQTLAELLGEDRPLDPTFAANEDTE